MMANLQEVAERYLEWAARTFDPMDQRPGSERFAGALRHAVKEIGEVRDDPFDAKEYTDVIGLVLFAARLAGHSLDDLTTAWEAKLVELEGRTWARGPDGLIEHVRD
jgi:hypothetical protein